MLFLLKLIDFFFQMNRKIVFVELTANNFESGQPHKKFKQARQLSQVVNWVKNKPRFSGNQIPFRGTRFGFV